MFLVTIFDPSENDTNSNLIDIIMSDYRTEVTEIINRR